MGATGRVIVRILLWRIGEDHHVQLDGVRAVIDDLEPLEAPSTWLVNEVSESLGVIVVTDPDEDEGLPEQIATIREIVGREPDLYEEYDSLS